MKHILLIDDDVAVTNYFRVFLAQSGAFETTVVNDPREVGPLLEQEHFDLVLLDMDMPHVSGMDILREMNACDLHIPVIILTGVNDVDLAVRSMKLGAFDYLVKPIEDEKFLETINSALEQGRLHRNINELPDTLTHTQLAHVDAFEHLPTQDADMARVLHQAEQIASSDLSIFIWGESGTGKEALARAIHQASPRKDNPFIVVEAHSFAPEQFPAFFFGQVRGWGKTREEMPGFLDEADGGTIFLNHIEHVTQPVQLRLKRFIQTREFYRQNSAAIHTVNVRMIVATQKDLESSRYEQQFNRDLLYHLMINSLHISPLRERIDDIPLLAEYFLREEVKTSGKALKGFSDGCLDILKQYHYPYNLQELHTIVASAAAREEGSVICADSLPHFVKEGLVLLEEVKKRTFEPRTLDDVIWECVKNTLEYCDGEKEKTAAALGISLTKLHRILEGQK